MSLILSGTDGLSDVDGSAATPAIRGTDANTGMFFPAADTIAFSEGGVEAMRLDSAGNVGIGTSSPTQKLEIVGDIQQQNANYLRGKNSAGTPTRLFGLNGVNTLYIGSIDADHSGGTFFVKNGATQMTLDSSGNVGIGTSLPTSKLDVLSTSGSNIIASRNTSTTSSDSAQMQCVSGGVTFQAYAYSFAAEAVIGTVSNHPLAFRTNSTERMRIDSSGRITGSAQPLFAASHTNSSLVTGTIVWDTVHFNVGSRYNSSNGIFTAPVAGTYFFKAHTLTSNAAGGEIRMALYRNGGLYGGLIYITIKPSNNWWTTICEGHMYLNANDTVQVVIQQNPGTLYGDASYNAFSGGLLW